MASSKGILIGNFVPKSPWKVIFSGENREKTDFFWIFKLLWYRSICNVNIHFLSKFVKEYWFWGSCVIFRFYRFTWTLTRIYENRRYLSRKSCNFWSKAARAFKFCHFMSYIMHLKFTNFWGSRKISSMCIIENTEGGAILHPPPRDRLNLGRVKYATGTGRTVP